MAEQMAESGAKRELKKFEAWNIIERKPGEKAFWHKVGIGYLNRDGSINVLLDSIPLQGKVQLREDNGERGWQKRPAARPGPNDDVE